MFYFGKRKLNNLSGKLLSVTSKIIAVIGKIHDATGKMIAVILK